jgi:hypothetical protein
MAASKRAAYHAQNLHSASSLKDQAVADRFDKQAITEPSAIAPDPGVKLELL